MQGYPEYKIEREHVLEVIVSASDIVFGRIYRVRNNVHRERGLVTAYKQQADAETYYNHWCAECYIDRKSYSDALLEGIGKTLLEVTACSEPLMVNICFGERTDNRYKTFGRVWQEDD